MTAPSSSPPERERFNAAQGDPDWCGHWQVSRRDWACPDCERPVTPEMRAVLEAFPSVAPDGWVWVLISHSGGYQADPTNYSLVEGVYRDYRSIPAAMVRAEEYGVAELRERLNRLHWHQGAFNHGWMQFWDETVDVSSDETCVYELRLMEIDKAF